MSPQGVFSPPAVFIEYSERLPILLNPWLSGPLHPRPAVVATMMARLEELRATRLVSPFGGGHHNAAACAAWAKSGGVSPWEQ